MPLNLKETTSDWLVCQCGNQPHFDGFFPCTATGFPVEPVGFNRDGLWEGELYVCGKCYSIYNIDTFDETGVACSEAIEMLNEGWTLETYFKSGKTHFNV